MNSTADKKVAELEEELEKFTVELTNVYEELDLIYEITNEMGTLLDPESISIRVLDKAVNLVGVRVGFLMLFENGGNNLRLSTCRGFETGEVERFNKYDPFKGVAGMALSKREPVIWCDVKEQEEAVLGMNSCLAVPICVKEEMIGLLCLGDKNSGEPFYSSDKKLLFTLATQVGAIFATSRLYYRVEALLLDTIKALVSAIEQKDPYTSGHSERVAEVVEAIAGEMSLPKNELDKLKVAAILHDVGKIGIRASILTKPGKLEPEEWEMIKQHPEKSVCIIKNIAELNETISSIYHHHERYSGGGYPDGISGEEIPLGARIIAVADTFDAMNSNRAYRNKLGIDDILAEITRSSGTQFDPKVVDFFFAAFKKGKVKY